MVRGTATPSPVGVQKYLKGVDYPATKDDLISRAKDNGAPDDVVRFLQRLPHDEYDGPDNVMKDYGELQ